MPRTSGSKNIVAIADREQIDTSETKNIKHIASVSGAPLEKLKSHLKHQGNFLRYLASRHSRIKKLNGKLKDLDESKAGYGAKDDTFNKYEWYAAKLVLLEAVNAFEVFYKRTIIQLAEALQQLVPPENMNYNVEAPIIWDAASEDISVPGVIFEAEIFHNLDRIDKATQALVGEKRYNQNSPRKEMKARVRAIRCVFQIRHTLSHNNGLVTSSDATKFKALGFSVEEGQFLDPTKSYLRRAVTREIKGEASDFTGWLREQTVSFLTETAEGQGGVIPEKKREQLEGLLGADEIWEKVPWK